MGAIKSPQFSFETGLENYYLRNDKNFQFWYMYLNGLS